MTRFKALSVERYEIPDFRQPGETMLVEVRQLTDRRFAGDMYEIDVFVRRRAGRQVEKQLVFSERVDSIDSGPLARFLMVIGIL